MLNFLKIRPKIIDLHINTPLGIACTVGKIKIKKETPILKRKPYINYSYITPKLARSTPVLFEEIKRS